MKVGLNIRSFVSEQASEYVFMDAEFTKICWVALHFTAERSGCLNACASSFCCVAEGETKQNNDIESKARLLDGQNFKSALLVQRATSFVAGQKTCFFANVDNKYERMQAHKNMHLFPHTYQSTIPLPSSSVEKYAP